MSVAAAIGNASRTGERTALLTLSPVVAATLFNAVLCFLFTRGLPVSAATVAACEIAITAAALFLGRDAIGETVLIALLGLYGFAIALWLIARGDPAMLRNLGIPFAFFVLGAARGKVEDADRVVYALLAVTGIVALFEWFDLSAFTRVFDILSYYIAKGEIPANITDPTGKSLFGSGMRAANRMFLPSLGLHRVSSVFLEPLSIANFAAVSFAWLTCRLPEKPRLNGAFMLVCLGLIVLSDLRFAFGVCAVVALARMSGTLERIPVAGLAPLAVVILVAFTALGQMAVIDNSASGRLFGSGALLSSFSVSSWLGLSPLPVSMTVDSGFAYLFGNLGLIGAGIAWLVFVSVPAETPLGRRFRSVVAIYLTVSLSVNASVFSIKTAGLTWFLFGVATARGLRA